MKDEATMATNDQTVTQAPFEREDRYIVIKRSHHTDEQLEQLGDQMFLNGIGSICAVVVEADWPEYEPVWQMIENRMSGRPAHSGEGRSNGAGEDAVSVHRITRAAAELYMLDIRTLEHFGLISDAALSAPQGEVERLREALVEHFPTGIRGLYEQSAQRIPVQTHVGTNCLCGWCTSATDEQEVREEWAAHVAAALAQPEAGDD